MRNTQLANFVRRLFNNNSMVFSLSLIFHAATEGTVVSKDDFDHWFHSKAEELNLVGGRDFKYRVHGNTDSVFVKGHIGLAMLISVDNEIGAYARRIMIDEGWEIRWLLKVLTKNEA